MIRPGRNFSILLAAHFFFFLNFSQLILLPKYLLVLGLSPSETGIVMGSFSVSVLIALPAVGFLSEIISRRILFMTGSVLMAVPTVFYPEIGGMTTGLFMLRVLQGIGFSCAFGVAGAIVSDSHPDSEKVFFLGILTVAGLLTQAIGPVFGEYLIRSSGYDALFQTASAFGVMAFCLAFFLQSGPHGRPERKKKIDLSFPILAATGILGIVFGSMVIYLPPYLMTCGVRDSSPFFLGFVAGGLLVWTVLHRMFESRHGRMVWIIMSMLLVIPFLFVKSTGSLPVLGIVSLLSGIGYGYLYPILNAGMIGLNSSSKGMANALFVWSFNVGMLLASVGFGYLCENTGYEKAFFVTAAASFIFLAASGMLHLQKADIHSGNKPF